jgi:uncharacterized protein (DUF3820 family)
VAWSGRLLLDLLERLLEWFAYLPGGPFPQERVEKLGLYQITIQENQDSVEFCSKITPLF